MKVDIDKWSKNPTYFVKKYTNGFCRISTEMHVTETLFRSKQKKRKVMKTASIKWKYCLQFWLRVRFMKKYGKGRFNSDVKKEHHHKTGMPQKGQNISLRSQS